MIEPLAQLKMELSLAYDANAALEQCILDKNKYIAALEKLIDNLKGEVCVYKEYYEAVISHPVNYSYGNYDRVMAAIIAIKELQEQSK